MVKLIFTDLDGTFLDDDKCVPAVNERMLRELDELGIGLVPCSGRMLSGIPEEMSSHPCVSHAICSDGACIVEFREGSPRVLFSGGLEKASVVELYESLRPFDIQFDVFADGRSYSERERWLRLDEFPIDPGMRKFAKEQRTPVDATVPEFIGSLGNVERLNIYLMDLADYDAVCACAGAVGGMHCDPHSVVGIEITNENLSKATGMAWLAQRLGVGLSECVAFGDGENDLAMLEKAGLGVAMSNACDKALQAADDVTRLNNAMGGVGDYVLCNVLNQRHGPHAAGPTHHLDN